MSILQKVYNKFHLSTSDEYISELKKQGVKIGKRCVIWDPSKTTIDTGRPWLLEIGDYVKITAGVVILTHDYSLSVMRRVYGEWLGEGKKTVIGDNVFIGMNSIILMGSHIGNNVIIGAGSVVRGNIPDNVVIAGNPAKIICSLEEHYNNRVEKTRIEALQCARDYYDYYNRAPGINDLLAFKFLFLPRDRDLLNEYGIDFFCNGDEPSEVEAAFFNSKPIWNGLDELLEEAGIPHTKQ